MKGGRGEMDKLTKLAMKHGTDKCPENRHSYTPYYYDLFKDKRKKIKKVLEIGILEGASLRVWRDFFPNAQIYGADIDPESVKSVEGEDRIEAIECDQSNKNDLLELIKKTGNDIDFLLDDGSHVQKDQYNTCLTLMPLLKKDIIYIIEDVRVARNIVKRIRNHYDYEEIGFYKGRRHDDRIIIVKHKI